MLPYIAYMDPMGYKNHKFHKSSWADSWDIPRICGNTGIQRGQGTKWLNPIGALAICMAPPGDSKLNSAAGSVLNLAWLGLSSVSTKQ